MIINVRNFIAQEKKYWDELQDLLEEFEAEPIAVNDFHKLKRLHYLYQRASSDLARIMSFSSEQILKEHLESLVSRAYSEIHETRREWSIKSFLKSFAFKVPSVFQKYHNEFLISCFIFFLGSLLGGAAISFDSNAKDSLIPFQRLMERPQDRVKNEEKMQTDRLEGNKATFSSSLWVNNTRVSIATIALGITWGFGSVIILFNNGVLIGAVALEYINTGQTKFLLGWLLPHGVIEIPAILIAGQIGLILGGGMIGWGNSLRLTQRLRLISSDILTLSLAVLILLSWAGFVEAFISHYHRPVISYELKIFFGFLEFIVLIYFLYFLSRKNKTHHEL